MRWSQTASPRFTAVVALPGLREAARPGVLRRAARRGGELRDRRRRGRERAREHPAGARHRLRVAPWPRGAGAGGHGDREASRRRALRRAPLRARARLRGRRHGAWPRTPRPRPRGPAGEPRHPRADPALPRAIPLVRIDTLHGSGLTGTDRKMGFLDTGIDLDHPDLEDAIAAEQCFCPGRRRARRQRLLPERPRHPERPRRRGGRASATEPAWPALQPPRAPWRTREERRTWPSSRCGFSAAREPASPPTRSRGSTGSPPTTRTPTW